MAGYETLTVTYDKGVGIIQFSRPDRMNSFIPQQYSDLCQAFKEVDNDPRAKVCLWTGKGKFFSSGHDLAEQKLTPEEAKLSPLELSQLRQKQDGAGEMIACMIDAKKPIIAGINGPAYGISVTILGLCDVVYASDTASFTTPFMQLGFCAEGCSSVRFAEIMGSSKANEMLLMGKTLTAVEAERVGFVSEIFPQAAFHEMLMKKANRMASYPPIALQETKALSSNYDMGGMTRREFLHKVSRKELEQLAIRMASKESLAAITAFRAAQEEKKRRKQAAKAKAKL